MDRVCFRSALCGLVLAALLVAGATGCRSGNRPPSEKWLKSVNSIKPGATMDAVRDEIGRPDEKREGEAPVRPYPPIGSPEGVLGTLPPETKYEQWIYKRGDSHYHVFFTRTSDDPVKWEVIAVRSVPESAVY